MKNMVSIPKDKYDELGGLVKQSAEQLKKADKRIKDLEGELKVAAEHGKNLQTKVAELEGTIQLKDKREKVATLVDKAIDKGIIPSNKKASKIDEFMELGLEVEKIASLIGTINTGSGDGTLVDDTQKNTEKTANDKNPEKEESETKKLLDKMKQKMK